MAEYVEDGWSGHELEARLQAIRQRLATLCGDQPQLETPGL
jgi:hypothetical protein